MGYNKAAIYTINTFRWL